MDAFIRLPIREQRDYIEQTAGEMGLAGQIIEKDFWVCWTLKTLFSLPGVEDTLLFKGGTSLSKVFHMIERFSEDIDVSIDRASMGFGDEKSDPAAEVSSNERKRRRDRLKNACQHKVAKELLPKLDREIESGLGTTDGWLLDLAKDDPDQQTLLFHYPSTLTKQSAYILPAVRVEFGARADHWPSDQHTISPYVAQQYPGAFSTSEVTVKTLSAERTFWEKATLLHAEHHRPPEKAMPHRLSRHYYDLSQMIRSGLGEKMGDHFDLLQQVVQHKKVFFQSAWAYYEDAKPGSLRLHPRPECVEPLSKDYHDMREMFFAEPLPFQGVLQTLSDWEQRFNQNAL